MDKLSDKITHGWCSLCDGIRAILIDDMGGKDTTDTFYHPTDIVCSDCRSILCTLFANQP